MMLQPLKLTATQVCSNWLLKPPKNRTHKPDVYSSKCEKRRLCVRATKVETNISRHKTLHLEIDFANFICIFPRAELTWPDNKQSKDFTFPLSTAKSPVFRIS